MDADEEQTVHRRRVPAGTSEYQAAWILDDDGAVGGDEDEADDQPVTPSRSAAGPGSLGEITSCNCFAVSYDMRRLRRLCQSGTHAVAPGFM